MVLKPSLPSSRDGNANEKPSIVIKNETAITLATGGSVSKEQIISESTPIAIRQNPIKRKVVSLPSFFSIISLIVVKF